jgi:hypothetical protein
MSFQQDIEALMPTQSADKKKKVAVWTERGARLSKRNISEPVS